MFSVELEGHGMLVYAGDLDAVDAIADAGSLAVNDGQRTGSPIKNSLNADFIEGASRGWFRSRG